MRMTGRPRWSPNILVRSNLYHESPYCTALSDLNVWNVGAFEGVTSEYRCMALVLRWCGVYGIVYIFAKFLWKPWVWSRMRRCMRVRVVPIPPASVPLFNLQTRWSEIFRELTMRTVISIGHSTILSRFVKMSTTNLLSHLRSANQGSDYLKYSFFRLQKPLSC